MAKIEITNPKNVPGSLFVDTTCIDCGTCFHLAPTLFKEQEDQSVVIKQPIDIVEWSRAKEAVVSCPTNSIGVRSAERMFAQARVELPKMITDGIYYCGYTSSESFGAGSYLIRHAEGNVLVDSPRYNQKLVDKIAQMGGLDLIFLTHRDDVADHRKFARRFNCKRAIHKAEINASTKDCEFQLEGEDVIELTSFLKAIPTPGHTEGHTVLLFQNQYLFSGDHLFFDQDHKKIYMSENVNWYSWPKQVASLKKLLNYHINWILPGHGAYGHLEAQEVRAQMEQIVRNFSKEVMMNKVEDVMHENPEFCTLETRIPDIKYLMKKYDYNEMAVVNGDHVPVGVINVEAISDEALGEYVHPFDLKAEERMRPLNIVVKRETPLVDCLKFMDKAQVNSLPVVDELGHYCGIVRKSDIVRH